MHKDARLRKFFNEDEAVKYVQTGNEIKSSDTKSSSVVLEKATFRAPTKHELIEFRKAIERDDYSQVKTTIWDNPRFLVSSGDTPTTLKEGYRYNALHCCAISNKPRIAELILQTVSDTKFVDLLVGKKNDEKMCKELCMNLLDYYLNIPEKGRSETPLHFAVKVGHIEMVEVLTSYPECKMIRNKDGYLPKEIICSRMPVGSSDLCKKIESLLEERYYVPVLRTMDDAIPPSIEQPFSPNKPPEFNSDPLSPEVKIQALAGPMSIGEAKNFRRRWKTPPRNSTISLGCNSPFISPRKNCSTATKFENTTNNVTPTAMFKIRSFINSSPQSSSLTLNLLKDHNFSSSEIAKQNGNHRNDGDIDETDTKENINVETNNNNHGQQVANTSIQSPKMKPSKQGLGPTTPVLKLKKDLFFTYRDSHPSPLIFELSGSEDDNVFHSISQINNVEEYNSPGYKERHIKITDPEKGLEIIGRALAKEQNVEWREYWDFLNELIDITSIDGLQKLENYFTKRVMEEESLKKSTIPTIAMDDVYNALENLSFLKDISGPQNVGRNGFNSNCNGSNNLLPNSSNILVDQAVSQTTLPYSCVEKSLQVFAKRMTKTIVHNINNVVSINDTLLSELKRLKSLIYSFKEDTRFIDVNFTKVHSRIGNLISIYLDSSEEVTPLVKSKIQIILKNLLSTPGERREHIECICSRIIALLTDPVKQILPENLKTEKVCSTTWCQEDSCNCQWDTNLSRKTSRRNRIEARFKNYHQSDMKREIKPTESNKWRDASSGNNSSDELESEKFWSDLGESDSDNDAEEIWVTPPESPIENIDNSYQIFIYGNEPTKRDLDVFNATFHIDVDEQKFPNVYSWRKAILSYSSEEMAYFPSPSIIKQSHSFSANTIDSFKNSFELQQNRKILSTPKLSQKHLHQQQLVTARQLFNSSPLRLKTITNTTATAVTTIATSASITGPATTTVTTPTSSHIPHNSATQPPNTPLNKLRGLFSVYRERLDSSPLSASMITPPSFFNDHSSSDSSKKLSLFNISPTE